MTWNAPPNPADPTENLSRTLRALEDAVVNSGTERQRQSALRALIAHCLNRIIASLLTMFANYRAARDAAIPAPDPAPPSPAALQSSPTAARPHLPARAAAPRPGHRPPDAPPPPTPSQAEPIAAAQPAPAIPFPAPIIPRQPAPSVRYQADLRLIGSSQIFA